LAPDRQCRGEAIIMTQPSRSPSRKISAVVSDVDGTLVTDEKLLTDRTKEAVSALRSRGIVFTIISSRPPRGLRMVVDTLKIAVPFGGFNGGMIVAPDRSVVTEHLLPPEVAQRAVEMLTGSDAQSWIFSGQDWVVRDPGESYIRLEERTVGFPPTVAADFTPFLHRAGKIVGVSTDFDRLAQCEHDIRAELSDAAFVARSQPQYLDITHPLANKGVGLQALSELLSIPVTEIAAIGDGGNDIAMFERAGLSIAMGNAAPAVQRAADFVTGSNRENGFAAAIERFILGGKPSSEPLDTARAGARG
jgi:Cof subfamily protein (haloacid dehalogenase superfamily)